MDDARGDFLGPANGTSSRHPKEVGTKVFIMDIDHTTKMTTTPIYTMHNIYGAQFLMFHIFVIILEQLWIFRSFQ